MSMTLLLYVYIYGVNYNCICITVSSCERPRVYYLRYVVVVVGVVFVSLHVVAVDQGLDALLQVCGLQQT